MKCIGSVNLRSRSLRFMCTLSPGQPCHWLQGAISCGHERERFAGAPCSRRARCQPSRAARCAQPGRRRNVLADCTFSSPEGFSRSCSLPCRLLPGSSAIPSTQPWALARVPTLHVSGTPAQPAAFLHGSMPRPSPSRGHLPGVTTPLAREPPGTAAPALRGQHNSAVRPVTSISELNISDKNRLLQPGPKPHQTCRLRGGLSS